jgi:hypothetical protein
MLTPEQALEHTMSDAETRRAALSAMRRHLEDESAALHEEANRLVGSRDPEALHAHSERIRRHHAALNAYTNELEKFHHDVGPVGD